MKIAIDFDGVIHDYRHPVEGLRMGGPVVGALDAIEEYLAAGHEVVVFTQRGDRPDHVITWLAYYGFPPLTVTNIKSDFDLIIDDRAVTFTNWESITGGSNQWFP